MKIHTLPFVDERLSTIQRFSARNMIEVFRKVDLEKRFFFKVDIEPHTGRVWLRQANETQGFGSFRNLGEARMIANYLRIFLRTERGVFVTSTIQSMPTEIFKEHNEYDVLEFLIQTGEFIKRKKSCEEIESMDVEILLHQINKKEQGVQNIYCNQYGCIV